MLNLVLILYVPPAYKFTHGKVTVAVFPAKAFNEEVPVTNCESTITLLIFKNTFTGLTNKLIVEMSQYADRSARFVTVLTFHQNGQFYQFEGEIRGEIMLSPRGNQGFGYDPLFQPENESRTFAEMTLSEKNLIAHRARALHKFKTFADENLKFADE